MPADELPGGSTVLRRRSWPDAVRPRATGQGVPMSRRQGRSIPNALHSELPHTDQDGRINDVRAQAGEQKREAWCMIAARG